VVAIPFSSVLLNFPDEGYVTSVSDENNQRIHENILAIKRIKIDRSEASSTSPIRDIVTNSYLDNAFSGRIIIWRYYLSEVNFIGHDVHQIPGFGLMIGGHSNGHKPGDIIAAAPHNIIIDIAYRSGIVAGCFVLVFLLFAFVNSISRFFIKRTFSATSLFTCVAVVGYLANVLLSLEWMPFHFTIVVIFFIGISPLMFSTKPQITKGGII
jgi:hypothetical protein